MWVCIFRNKQIEIFKYTKIENLKIASSNIKGENAREDRFRTVSIFCFRSKQRVFY